MDVVRRDRPRPDDAVLVVVLLDRRGHDPRRADAVAPADQRLLRAVLVEERRAERLRVARAELEDVADLDRRLEAERAAAHRDSVALAGLADVGEARLVVAAGLDAEQVPAVAVRAGDELPLAQRLVGDRPRRRRRPGRAIRRRLRTRRGSPRPSPGGSRSRARRASSARRAGRRRARARARARRRSSRPASPSTSPRRRCRACSASASIVVTPGVATSFGRVVARPETRARAGCRARSRDPPRSRRSRT